MSAHKHYWSPDVLACPDDGETIDLSELLTAARREELEQLKEVKFNFKGNKADGHYLVHAYANDRIEELGENTP